MLELTLSIAGLLLVGHAIERMKINTINKMDTAEFKWFSQNFRKQYNGAKNV